MTKKILQNTVMRRKYVLFEKYGKKLVIIKFEISTKLVCLFNHESSQLNPMNTEI